MITIILVIIGLFVVFLIYLGISGSLKQNPSINDKEVPSPTPTQPPFAQKPFEVLSVDPKNNQIDVDSGEIDIIITTDNPIISEKSFFIYFSPALPYYFKITNQFPSNQIIVRVYGGFKPNTIYTVSIHDANNVPLYSWSFTTSKKSGESSSSYILDQEKEYNQKYYPLFDFIPYSSPDFDLDYVSKFSLEVKIKNSNTAKIKQEVLQWIRDHNVDPNTHVINYTNVF